MRLVNEMRSHPTPSPKFHQALTSIAALEVKSQKSKDLYSRLLRHLEWYVYLRRAVLVFDHTKFDG
jgi:hypothetical protein